MGVEGAESGGEGAESGVEGEGSGGRGGGKRGYRGRGAWKDWGGKSIFFYRKFKENGSFMPISNIKVHQEKYAYLCGLFCHTTHVMYGMAPVGFQLDFYCRSKNRDYRENEINRVGCL